MAATSHSVTVRQECELVPRYFWACDCGLESTLNFADADQAADDSRTHRLLVVAEDSAAA